VVALGIIILLALNSSYTFGASFIPHEDPGTAREDLDPLSILFTYIMLLQYIFKGDYLNFTFTLDLLDLASFPSSIEYIINRLDELLRDLGLYIDSANKSIIRARNLIELGDWMGANESLRNASYYIVKANMTLIEIEMTVNELIRALRGFLIPGIEDKFREFQDILRKLLMELLELLLRLREILTILEEEVFELHEKIILEEVVKTSLTLYVEPREQWINSSISIYGYLTAVNGTILSNRSLVLTLDYEVYDIVFTDNEGYYNYTLRIPPVYKDRLTLGVYYKPQGLDIDRYAPSKNETFIKVLYIKTWVSLNISGEAYPGYSLTIGINLEPSNVSRAYTLFFDNRVLYQGTLNKSNTVLPIELPPDIPIGGHLVSITIYPKGVYGPATDREAFTVSYKEYHASLRFRRFIIYPLHKIYLDVSLRDKDNLPLYNASVEVRMKGRLVARGYTNSFGLDTLSYTPIYPGFGGYMSIELRVDPMDPWYQYKVYTYSIYILNLYSLFIVTASITGGLGLGYGYTRRRRRRVEAPKEIVAEVEEEVVEEPEVTVKPVKGIVLPLYYEALRLVEPIAGTPHDYETLREYYMRIRDKLDDASDAFYRLTLLAEYELYSGYKPSDDMVLTAKRYLNMIRGVFHG
jgi:hypothetical protein